MEKIVNGWTLSITVVVLLIGIMIWNRSADIGPGMISRTGIHWHPHLSIKIRGQQVIIPLGVGLQPVENAIHIHDLDNIIHLEFSGVVRESNLRLENFFKVWGKSLTSECLVDTCIASGEKIRMLVNGIPNDTLGNYIMRDKDEIELILE